MPELLLVRVDLLEGGVDRGLAGDEHAPVVEHLLRHLDRGHLARLQHPVGLAGERAARLVPALADEQRAFLGRDAFEAEQLLAHAPGARLMSVVTKVPLMSCVGLTCEATAAVAVILIVVSSVAFLSIQSEVNYRSRTSVSFGSARDTQT